MKIEAMAPSALSQAHVETWRGLQTANPGFDSPFLSPDWALAVERAQKNMRGGVRVVVVGDGGEARGFLAARVAGAAAMPAGAPMCDYQALVCDPDFCITPRRLVEALGVDRLDFSHGLISQEPFASFIRGSAPSHVIDLSDGYEAYAKARRAAGSDVIKDIDKSRRKFERDMGPLSFAADSRDGGDLLTLMAWKSRQYQETGQADVLASRWAAQLLRDLFAATRPDFGGMMFTLRAGDRLIAAQFNLRGRRTLHCWFIAHDPEFERYSPGMILFGEMMRWMDGQPQSQLDLGAGDYRFKLRLANRQTQIGHGFIGRPSPAAFVRSAQYGVRAAAERLPLGAVSALPGKAMRRLDTLRGLR